MNLNLTNKLFLVSGATSGFGRAIAEALLNEALALSTDPEVNATSKRIQHLIQNQTS